MHKLACTHCHTTASQPYAKCTVKIEMPYWKYTVSTEIEKWLKKKIGHFLHVDKEMLLINNKVSSNQTQIIPLEHCLKTT